MFSISEMIVDSADKVVAVNWAFTNDDGVLSNQWKLAEPYGDTPLNEVTEEKAVEWLVAQLPNTAEELSAAISARKAEVEYEATLSAYNANAGAPPTKIEPPTETPSEE
jgi:hypothetical protein|tara:strand:- start:457 stop:783 length:327 start_codon:yes stop_codon:yes gene_type:complete